MIRCSRCVIPDTRPDTEFVAGVCSACLAFERRPNVDWLHRKVQLIELLDRHGFQCIVPSSGGKDSTYQVMTLLGLGAKVTVVTASTCHLTPQGRKNIDNLARHAPTIEVTQNRSQRARLNRLGLEMVGDISWPEHVSIFTTPFRVAKALGINLIMYGENPQAEYGGPSRDSQEAQMMTRRWVSEFGGFLGLRASDVQAMGYDMSGYMLPKDLRAIEAHFLGTYIPWDSHRNARVAADAGMEWHPAGPTPANWWPWENLDNAQTGIHDYMMYLKYGYGRGAAQISVDIRHGHVSREFALGWLKEHEAHFPHTYAGVGIGEVLGRLNMTRKDLQHWMDAYTNWDLFRRVEDDVMALPVRIN